MRTSCVWVLVALAAIAFVVVVRIAKKQHEAPVTTSALCAKPHNENDGCINLDALLAQDELRKKNAGPQTITVSDPAIKKLLINTMKSYACQEFMNHYAKMYRISYFVVSNKTRLLEAMSEVDFSTQVHNVCGTIRFYFVPVGIACPATYNANDRSSTSQVRDRYLSFIHSVYFKFFDAESDLSIEGNSWAQRYVPEGEHLARPSNENVSRFIQKFTDDVVGSYRSAFADGGWTASESNHFASLLKCSVLLPEASGPDMEALGSYPAAFGDYLRFEHDLDEAMK